MRFEPLDRNFSLAQSEGLRVGEVEDESANLSRNYAEKTLKARVEMLKSKAIA